MCFCELLKCRCSICKKRKVYYRHLKSNKNKCIECFYSYGVINKVDELKECDICMKSKNNIVKLTCGHELCENCWDDIHKFCKEKTCPFCREQNKLVIEF